METKHTPGPWKYTPDGFISGVNAIARTTDTGTPEERKANAKLIAAAPDLAEQIKNLLFAFRSSAESEIQKAAIKYAENALSKAGINL